MPTHNIWDFLIAVVLLVGQVIVFLQSRKTGAKVDLVATDTKKQVDAVVAQVATVETKVDGVHILVNSGLSQIIAAKDDLIQAQTDRAVRAEGQVDKAADDEPLSVQDQSNAAAQAHNAEREKKKE